MPNTMPVADNQPDVSGSATPGHVPPAEIVITGDRGWHLPNLAELWRFRDLFVYLGWRDVKVRYKQSVLGAAWAIIQPVAMMLVFTAVLGRISNRSSGDIPYPIFVYTGLLPWTLFASALNSSANSIIGSERLITKVFFPRLIIPIAAVGYAIIDFLVALGVLLALMLWYKVMPTWSLLLAPLPIILLVAASLAAGTILSAFNVIYRDFRHALPFLVQIWMLATPTIYLPPAVAAERTTSESAVSSAATSDTPADEKLSAEKPNAAGQSGAMAFLRVANPPLGLIRFFRATVLGGPLPWTELIAPTVVSLLGLLVSCMVFQRLEDSFADVI